jgi:hypothetical protein
LNDGCRAPTRLRGEEVGAERSGVGVELSISRGRSRGHGAIKNDGDGVDCTSYRRVIFVMCLVWAVSQRIEFNVLSRVN